jgi:biotin operon repressor
MILRKGLNGDKSLSGPDIGKLLGISKQAVSSVEATAWKRIERAQTYRVAQLMYGVAFQRVR